MVETVADFIFLGSKITADGDCSHEIKRRLLLGRKVMINLDSIWKSRDITLPTKVHLVKAMVFPMVMYGCESWTTKKSTPKNWCFWTAVLEKTLKGPLDCKEIQPVHPEIGPGCSLEGLMLKLKLQYFGHLLRRGELLEKTLIWERLRAGGEEDDRDEMVGWHHQLDGHGFVWTPGVGDGQGGLACCSSWGHKDSDTTEQVNWTI